MSDGRIDGHFIIKNGGITQGIAQELGLSKDECRMISGSIWSQVINEFENSENMSVTNNRNTKASNSNGYLVYENAVVKFSKDCWSRIVNLINQALDKNIQVDEADTNTQQPLETDIKTTEPLTSLQQKTLSWRTMFVTTKSTIFQ